MNAHYGYGHGAWQRGDALTQVDEYEQGTLVIDIIDTGRDALVWRGVGQARLRSQTTPEQSTERVPQPVSQIPRRFPPGAGG